MRNAWLPQALCRWLDQSEALLYYRYNGIRKATSPGIAMLLVHRQALPWMIASTHLTGIVWSSSVSIFQLALEDHVGLSVLLSLFESI